MTLSLEHPYIKSTPRQGVYWLTVPVQNYLDARLTTHMTSPTFTHSSALYTNSYALQIPSPMYGKGLANIFKIYFPPSACMGGRGGGRGVADHSRPHMLWFQS